MDKVTVANFINLANNMVGSGLIPTGEANYELAKEYATQQSRIEVAKVLEFLSNHKLDFQPASGGNFIGLNMEIYTPTEIDNLYLLSINKKVK